MHDDDSAHRSSDGSVLTVVELAKKLKVPPSWVYAHADSLGAYRLGKYIRFDWRTVQERLSAGAIPPAESHR